MNHKLALPLLIACAALWPAQANAKKHPSLPEVFASAKTVFVESREGDITDIQLDTRDRNAILDLQDGIQDWGRYALSRSRLDADLILVVHKGRIWRTPPNGSNLPGATIGSHSSTGHVPVQNPSDASNDSTTNNFPDGFTYEKDQLRVYTLQSDGKLKGPIWSGELERGLDGPNIQLLRGLKADIEKAYPAPPPKPQPTP